MPQSAKQQAVSFSSFDTGGESVNFKTQKSNCIISAFAPVKIFV
jgi:hypothetical protein